MAPCCEPADAAHYQPISVVLVRVSDLRLLEDWGACAGVEVEHGRDGARVLTLHALAKQYRAESEQIAGLRAAGKSTRYAERRSCWTWRSTRASGRCRRGRCPGSASRPSCRF